MLRFQVRTDCTPRTRNGQPPHSTTGVASTHWIHCTVCIGSAAGSRSGAMSATIASTNTGRASAVLIQKRRVMSASSGFSS